MHSSPEAGEDTWVGEFPPTVTVTKPAEHPALSERWRLFSTQLWYSGAAPPSSVRRSPSPSVARRVASRRSSSRNHVAAHHSPVDRVRCHLGIYYTRIHTHRGEAQQPTNVAFASALRAFREHDHHPCIHAVPHSTTHTRTTPPPAPLRTLRLTPIWAPEIAKTEHQEKAK